MDENNGKHRCVFDQFDREEPMGYYCKCGKRENSPQLKKPNWLHRDLLVDEVKNVKPPQHRREDKRGHRK